MGSAALPRWAHGADSGPAAALATSGDGAYRLEVTRTAASIGGRPGGAILVNGQLPGPLLRWREGERVTLQVTNRLSEPTSIHWHGLLLPAQMDGVPGVSFPGIAPGDTFHYRFDVRQAGTYWYHSHSGLQEQLGHYGPIVIVPAEPDPVVFHREHVIVLSDWTFEDPHRLAARLKKQSDVYNYQQRTVGDFLLDVRNRGLAATWRDRAQWGRMRMNPTDIADVTAATYTYLINGQPAAQPWRGRYRTGERVRLRFINAAAMSIFNVRIPGLPMTVVQTDGIDVQPVETDEFQLGVAETLDVLVEPTEPAYALVAEASDRSGLVSGVLASRPGLTPVVPALRSRPTLSMRDMAMHHDHPAEPAGSAGTTDPAPPADPHGQHAGAHEHSGHTAVAATPPTAPQRHDHARGPGVAGLAEWPTSRLAERPLGLEEEPHRVLVYAELRSLKPNPDQRPAGRTVELHLTGNMERYMWSFDGLRFSEVEDPIVFHHGERLRLVLVNDTMMPHPIHLHGMYMDLDTGAGLHKPRKHTIVVKPGERLAADVSADAPGDWAFHCHLLYHMHAGMMQVVSVRESTA